MNIYDVVTLYSVVTAGVASGLGLFQWVLLPFGNFVDRVRDYGAAAKNSV